MPLTDEELALEVQKGHKETFGLLMERYEQKLFRYGRKFISDEDNIDDVVQEVFIKAYQNIQSFDVSQKFSPWIYRIAHNTYVNHMRKVSRGPVYLFDFDTLISHPVYEDPTEREREQKEMKAMIDESLKELSSQYKEVLILYYYEELGYKEIADVLRVPIGTVGIRLKRAKEALKKIHEKLHPHHEQSY